MLTGTEPAGYWRSVFHPPQEDLTDWRWGMGMLLVSFVTTVSLLLYAFVFKTTAQQVQEPTPVQLQSTCSSWLCVDQPSPEPTSDFWDQLTSGDSRPSR